MRMKVSGFPGCCGIAVLHNLDGITVQDLRRAIYGLTSLEASSLNNGDEDFGIVDDFDDLFESSDGIDLNLILASTIPSQKDAVAALTEFGFSKIVTFPGTHANDITLWGFDKTSFKACPVEPELVKDEFDPDIPKQSKGSTPIKPMAGAPRKAVKPTKKRKARKS